MSRFLIASILPASIVAPLLFSVPCHAADSARVPSNDAVAVAVVDFSYEDTSGEERDQRREHAARLDAFMMALRSDLAAHGRTVVTPTCSPAPCSATQPPEGVLRAAREAGAGILLVGGVHKMSTLVQNARVIALDAATGQVVADKVYTFRGDTDDSWRRAESFIAGDFTGI
jgi:hypothetical protein